MLATNLRRGGFFLPTFVSSQWGDSGGVNAATLTITKPTGVVSGDLMLAVMSGPGAGWTGDTGWTEVGDQLTNPGIRAAWKVATGSEGASYTFTTGSNKLGGYIQCWRGAAFDAIGAFYTSAGPNSNPIVMPTVTVAPNAMLLGFVASDSSARTYTTPSGMTARDANSTNQPSMASFYQAVASGASGTRSATPSGSANHAGVLISVKVA